VILGKDLFPQYTDKNSRVADGSLALEALRRKLVERNNVSEIADMGVLLLAFLY